MNNRVKYNFIKRLCQFAGIDLKPDIFKQISMNQINAEYKSESKVKKVVDSYNYLIENTAQSFDEMILDNSYYLLNGTRLSKRIADKIILYYYIYLDLPIHEMVCDIHVIIVKSRIKKKREFAFLITSYLLMRKGYYPIIILKEDCYRYKRAINCFENSSLDLYSLFELIEHRTRKQFSYDDELVMSKEKLISTLQQRQAELKNEYKVQHLYLFGSLSKNEYLTQSDIDLRITFSEDWEMSKAGLLAKLHDYLHDLLKKKIDLVETKGCIDSYIRSDYEQQLKIF